MKHFKSKKAIIPIIVLVLAVLLNRFGFQDKSEFVGEVEGVIISHSSEVSGKIIKSNISIGEQIKKGQIIAEIDNTNQKYIVEQLELNLQKTKIAQGNSKIGRGGTADNNYIAAKAGYDSSVVISEKAKDDYEKAKNLYKDEAITKNELDSSKLVYETALNSLREAQAKLENTADRTLGNLSDMDIKLLESQLNQQKEVLEKYAIKAECNGIVMSKNYDAGDMVSSGYNIADVSMAEEKYAVVYFPENRLGEIKYNQKVLIILDGKSIEGDIRYIDIKAQYTPKELQSAANRNQESVRVKILIPTKFEVNVGQKVKVRF